MTKARVAIFLSANLGKRMKICMILFMGLFCLFLQSCYFFTPPIEDPIIEDRVGLVFREETSTLAITPERRLLILNLQTNRFCAEPPAEVAQNISSALLIALKPPKSEASMELAKTLGTSAKQLFFRTQGIQFLRDVAYYYCQMYVNGAMDGATYLQKFESIIPIAEMLIKQEIPNIPKYMYDKPDKPSPPPIPRSQTDGSSQSTQPSGSTKAPGQKKK